MWGLTVFFPPKAQWHVDQVPDQRGRVAIVTGGNVGIGFETVRVLMSKGAKVYMAARSEERATKAIEALREMNMPGEVEWLKLDLADLQSIATFAQAYMAKEQRLDMLFNSAGVMNTTAEPKTKDGYELHLGTNSLGHHYLTQLLMPALRASAKATPDKPPRVCFTSSVAHYNASYKGFDPADPTGLNTWCLMPAHVRAYGTSKFCNILSAKWFDRHFGHENIVFSTCHPGILDSELMRNWDQGLNRVLVPLLKATFFYPPPMGAITQLYLNTAPEAKNAGGQYYVPWARKNTPSRLTCDEKLQETFAQWVDEQIAKHMGGAVRL